MEVSKDSVQSGDAHSALSKVVGSNQQSSRPRAKQPRHKHSQEEWNELRGVITDLYIKSDKKAEEVLEILETGYNFRVGLRKFKDWLKENGISKNVQKSDMFILYTKRHARLITEGKKTNIYKDKSLLDNARFDRFGERNCLDVDALTYQTAATPDGYTYATPHAAGTGIDWEPVLDSTLLQFSTTPRPMQAIFGDVFDVESCFEQDAHIHQIGVFGLRMASEKHNEDLSVLLQQCLPLAKDLMDFVSLPSASVAHDVSDLHPPDIRVPKVQITFTGKCSNIFTEPSIADVVSYLKHSETCSRLLQLSSADQGRWKQDWYAMDPDEQTTSKRLCETFLGIPNSYNDAMVFMHISVLLSSPKDLADTVIARISLGVDTRDVPECRICQRKVVSVDCISGTRAVQLNVPLQSAWSGSWKPSQISTTEITEHVRWCDYVYSLRGWFIHLSSCVRRYETLVNDMERTDSDWIEEDENEIWDEIWDPMDVCTPLLTFQPYNVATPAALCAFNDFGLVLPESSEEMDSPKFEPDATDVDVWDPNGS
ncbi:hypothetical protein P153DRAFT_394611 [Dothidotthia symphoricarpi CBS 119687]|uniref:Clr5 domain-containing protein n=1 Tax=Dothidotthia symphoricarpi CBS 119687 TaxID=1392245 RepID=A0A6A6AHG3_9PLEO|nr:uncharacterized protein P153DRAFT_394611 [Dothidotthia symphoricarpi CBS 119687]KAF2131250.1 hypothetical protein P153DRAFT_394611 [Dothidotthia symphoricarpi CBS 119687]